LCAGGHPLVIGGLACYCSGVKPLAFADLAQLPILRQYEEAFRKATGVSLKIVPPEEPATRINGGQENAFCALVTRTALGCESCLVSQKSALRGAARKRMAQQINCFAGLTDVAVPVLVGGRHLATLLSGQVMRREPTERDFRMVLNMIRGTSGPEAERGLRKAYFETPVVTAERFEAIIHLLNVFAQYLADYASRHAIAPADSEPAPVVNAKQFVQSHVEEPLTLARIVQHVNISRFYFCKLFKKATGMTLTEYIARVRVEKAKSLLVDPSLRISEGVYASGFGSIPRFNSVFKRHVGMPPTEYRATLRARLPA
jgi:AraC-like DNA-binding protein/ligand-binding sensor protein